MIYVCPFCGHDLCCQLIDGLTVCNNCDRIVESSIYNKLLSGYWIIKHDPNIAFDKFKFHSGLSEAEAIMCYAFCEDHCYGFEEYQKALRTLGMSPKIMQQSA